MGESRACQDFDAKGFISIVEKFVVYVADFFDTLSVIKGLIEFVLGLKQAMYLAKFMFWSIYHSRIAVLVL